MGKGKKITKGKKKQKPEKNYTADDLLNRVEEYVDCFQFELAIKFCEKALEIDPTNLRALEASGNVYAEFGDIEKSKSCFLKAIEIDRDHGHEKYMYLGQLSMGDEAKSYYLKGIEIMKNNLKDRQLNSSIETGTSAGSFVVTERDISNAYCALAEVFLTDSCEEEDAEKNCLEFAKLALNHDNENPEAYIVMANYLLSKDQEVEAKEVLQNCFDLLSLPDPEGVASLEDQDLQANATNGEDDNDQLKNGESKTIPFSSRFTLAKLLIEVELFEKAERLLMGLIEENDEDVEVWYMLGWNLFLQQQLDDACFFLTKALELYEKLQYEDMPLHEHLNELLGKCKSIECNKEDEEQMETE